MQKNTTLFISLFILNLFTLSSFADINPSFGDSELDMDFVDISAFGECDEDENFDSCDEEESSFYGPLLKDNEYKKVMSALIVKTLL